MLARHVKYRGKHMSEHIYEQRQMDAWHAYIAKGGKINFETFYARHVRVNEWIVNQMKESWSAESFLFEDIFDDPADAYANPNGGI